MKKKFSNQINIRFFILLFPIFFSLACFSAADDNFYKATYKGKHLGIPVTITRTLTQNKAGNYQFELKATGFPGKITETSVFSSNNKHLTPLSYKYQQRIFGIKKKREVEFDWDKNVAHYKKNGKLKKTHALNSQVQDQSLYQLQLMLDLNLNQETLNYDFVRKSRIKSTEFRIIDKEQFYFLNKKKYAAWKIEIVREGKDKQSTVFTVIPELYYQLAEITQVEKDGSSYKVSLTDISINEEKTRGFFQLSD